MIDCSRSYEAISGGISDAAVLLRHHGPRYEQETQRFPDGSHLPSHARISGLVAYLSLNLLNFSFMHTWS